MEQLAKVQLELEDTLKDLDVKLNRVLAKQEYDYMKCFTLLVKKKERELKALIMSLSEQSKVQGDRKDEKLRKLEVSFLKARENETKMDRQVHELKASIRKWKESA